MEYSDIATSVATRGDSHTDRKELYPSAIQVHYAMNWTKTECFQDGENGIFEAVAITFGVAIFLTNLIVVAAVKRGGRKLHKATFYCICNLAVADMLAGLLLLWVFGLQRIVLTSRTAQSDLVQKSLWTLTIWTSLMSQVVIAFDRYVTMGSTDDTLLPRWCIMMQQRQKRRMVFTGIALTWIIPTVVYVIPVMTVWNCASSCECYTRDNSTDVIYMTCLPTHRCSQVNPPFAKSSMLLLSLVLLLLPFLPFFLYLRIFFLVRKSTKNLSRYPTKAVTRAASGSYVEPVPLGNAGSSANNSTDDSGAEKSFITPVGSANAIHTATNGHSMNGDAMLKFEKPGIVNTQSRTLRKKRDEESSFSRKSNKSRPNINSMRPGVHGRNHERDMKLLRTLVIILSLFVISTVPLGVLFTISLTETDKTYVQPAKYLLTLTLFNSLVNPWIYLWRFREMRGAIKRLFWSPRSRGQVPDDTACGCCYSIQTPRLSFFSSQQSTKRHNSFNSSSAN